MANTKRTLMFTKSFPSQQTTSPVQVSYHVELFDSQTCYMYNAIVCEIKKCLIRHKRNQTLIDRSMLSLFIENLFILMGLGRRSIKYVLEHPPKYIDDIKIKKIRKMFSVKLLVRGERFCVWWVGGGGKTA